MSEAKEILQELLAAVPDSYQKTVGFPTYDILAAAALRLEEHETALDSARAALDPENLSGEALDAYIYPRTGQERNAATYAIGTVTVTGSGTVTAGDLFESGGGIRFEAAETVTIRERGTVAVRCRVPGAAGNLPPGSITMMPVQIPGIVSVTNDEATSEGYDAESDEAYYQRFLVRLQTPPTSGNRYHYFSWALETSGVGGARVIPLGKGENTVEVVLIDNTGKPASSGLVETVQAYIDPGSKGLGEGEAPIGAYCTVSAAEAVPLALSMTVQGGEGAHEETVRAAIRSAVEAYLGGLALTAYADKAIDAAGYSVSYARLGSTILDVPGVQDYEGLTVNGAAANVPVTLRQAATLGEVDLTWRS